jgi:FAD dependent oxidoreductase
VVEQDIAAAHNDGPRARRFHDSCGIGHYGIDIHRGGAGGQSAVSLETRPFQIPLGALIPRRVTNVLAAGKNLGVTHVTNGAFRVHPVEWNIGEAAGALAAFCVRERCLPRQVQQDSRRLRAFQRELLAAGVPLFWWSDLPDRHPAFVAAQLLGVLALFDSDRDLRFRPQQRFTPTEAQAVEERLGRPLPWPSRTMTRAEAAAWLLPVGEAGDSASPAAFPASR